MSFKRSYQNSRAAILPLVLVISTLTAVAGMSALKVARQETEIAVLTQSAYLLDQSVESLTHDALARFKSNPSCYSWEGLSRMRHSTDGLESLPSDCLVTMNQARPMAVNNLNMSVNTQTRFCTKRLASGYEAGIFANHEFRTESFVALSQPTPKTVGRWQYWALLGPNDALAFSGNYCDNNL